MDDATLLAYRRILKLDGFGAGGGLRTINAGVVEDKAPTWPSGIIGIEERADGFSGCSMVAGMPKLGKSILVLRSAVLAAEDGWSVFYFDGENGVRILSQRMFNILRRRFANWPEYMLDRWRLHGIGPGVDLDTIAGSVSREITLDDDKILIVIDSVNRLAKRMTAMNGQETKYFRHLTRIVDWATECNRLSKGKIATLLVSELTRARVAVGMDIEYSCENGLYMRKSEEPNKVDLEFFSRVANGGYLGEYTRVYGSCMFLSPSQSLWPRDSKN